MKWFALCLALAGFSMAASAVPVTSPVPAALRSGFVQLADATCPPPGRMQADGHCACPPTIICPLITNCPSPKVANAATNSCICPGDMHEAANGACVRCAASQSWDSAKRLCACAPGTTMGPTGRCVRCPPPALRQRGRFTSCGG